MNQNLIKVVLEYRLHLQRTQNRGSSVGFRTDLNKLLPVQEKDNSFERVICLRVKNKEALTSGVLVNNWVQMGLIVEGGRWHTPTTHPVTPHPLARRHSAGRQTFISTLAPLTALNYPLRPAILFTTDSNDSIPGRWCPRWRLKSRLWRVNWFTTTFSVSI